MSKHLICASVVWAVVVAWGELTVANEADRPPNFVVIFTDDQGYTDVDCIGSLDIRTPRLDAIVTERPKPATESGLPGSLFRLSSSEGATAWRIN